MVNTKCVNNQLIGDIFNHDGFDVIGFFFQN
jgi:hypothetical protein